MATTRNFNDMLNEYLPVRLLKEEMIKRNWLLQNIESDDRYYGSQIIVPFKGSQASSISYGALTAAADIVQSDFVRGSDTEKEVWGSLVFDSRDLMEHEPGRVPEDTFLRILPDELDDFMDHYKEMISINMLTGSYLAKVTDSSSSTGGDMIVDKIDRFTIGQKLTIDDDNSTAADVFVSAVNLNTSTVTFFTAADATGGGDFSAYTAAQNAKIYHPGAQASSLNNLRGMLLSSANGGDTNVSGVAKLSWPFLQAINISGSSVTATNILGSIFDGYTDVRSKARGNARNIVMSYKHWGSCLKAIDTQKGGYNVKAGETMASKFGYDSIEITSVKGKLNLVGVAEMPDDLIYGLDMKSMKFYTRGYFQKEISPDGLQYYRVRNTTGYQYICDMKLFGNLIVHKPNNNFVIHSISY